MNDPFIKVYEAFESDLCDKIVSVFEHNMETGCVYKRYDEVRRDNQLECNESVDGKSKNIPTNVVDEIDLRNTEVSKEFFEILSECIREYTNDIGIQGLIAPVFFKNMLVQRNEADKFQSYSSWHCETANRGTSDRSFVYILYLNDDFEGGETEFMFQKYKQKPKKGSLVIFPAGYTHTHRGGMLISGTKYIATGWTFWSE